jgi:hypothetical protein
MTPLTAGLDANGAELVSDRDKRKLGDIEKTFEQMDKQLPKKKKRGTDGMLPATPSNGHPPPSQRTKHKSVSRTNTSISTSMQANGSTQFQKVGCRRLPSPFDIIASLSQIPELFEEVLKYLPDCYFRSTIAVLAFSTILGPAHKDSIRTIQISTTMSSCTMGAYLTDLQSDDTKDIPNVSAVEFHMGTHGIYAIRFRVKCDDEWSNKGEKNCD